MGLAIDLANGWLEGSLDRRPLRRGPMTAMDRTAAKMTVTREGSFVVVKLIDDIQERLVIEPAELLAPGPGRRRANGHALPASFSLRGISSPGDR